ncbi:MAG TPA: AMP-binding protein [Sphingomonas sp.]|nr:AMP-binding protein [Sphingomonas sp.]
MSSDLAAVQKVSSLAYAHAMMAAWNERKIFVPLDPATTAALPGSAPERIIPIEAGGGWFRAVLALDDDPAPAQISFSSGTTGTPKPILISRRAISDTCQRLIDVMGLDRSVREYVGVPITYSFGLGRVRAVAAAGGETFLPERGFRIDEFARMLGAGEVNALSAVPTLLRLLIQQRALLVQAGGQLRWLEIGSQSMSAEEKAAIAAIFPNARIIQHYGLTEASRTTFLRIDGAPPDELASVGRATGRTEVRIDDTGHICIRGPHLADGVITPEGIIPAAGADGWLRTSDLGEMRDGALYFLGRADDLINVSGVKVPADFFEQRMLELSGAETGQIAVASRADPIRGEALLIAHLPDLDGAALRVVAEGLADEFGLSATDITIWAIDQLPRTETGKVQRRLLSQLHAERPASADDGPAIGGSAEESLQRMFARTFPGRAITGQDSFLSLNGDSLSYITVSLGVEEITGTLPEQWEAMSIAELARGAKAGGGRNWARVEAGILVRAIAPIMIVAHHAGEGAVRGGAALLLIVAGQNFGRFSRTDLIEQRYGKVFGTFGLNVLLPYWIILLGFFVAKRNISLPELLLVNNVLDRPVSTPFETWFVQVLLQAILIFAAVSLIPAIRRLWRDSPFAFSFVALAAACLLAIVHYVWLRDILDNSGRETSWQLWLFVLGLAINHATTQGRRILLAMVALGMASLMYGSDPPRLVAVVGGTMILLWVRKIALPTFLLPLITVIGSSSIFIYMMHGRAPIHSATADWPIDILRISLGIALGVVTWFCYEQVLRRVRPWVGRWRDQRTAQR